MRTRRASWSQRLILFTIILPGSTLAVTPYVGPPVGFGGWNINNGVIDTASSCAAANQVTCKVLSQDNGFIQELITDHANSDIQFIRVVVTDNHASGDGANPTSLPFSYENFIRFAHATNTQGIGNGMADKLRIYDSVQGLDLTVMQQRGEMRGNWAGSSPYQTSAEAWSTKILQVTSDAESNQTFDMTRYTYANDPSAPSLQPDSNVELGKIMNLSATTITDATQGQKVRFEQRERSGYYGLWANVFFGTPIVPANTTGLTLGGTQVTWNKGNDVKLMWTASNTGNNLFGTEAIVNVTSGAMAQETSSQATGPFGWTTNPFGPAPTF